MSFRTFGDNGLLLYGGVGEDEKIGDTDFISIAIVDRFVEFSFDLGGGMIVLKSLKQIDLGNALRYCPKSACVNNLFFEISKPKIIFKN